MVFMCDLIRPKQYLFQFAMQNIAWRSVLIENQAW